MSSHAYISLFYFKLYELMLPIEATHVSILLNLCPCVQKWNTDPAQLLHTYSFDMNATK
jgi:hypothetical protein